MYIGLYLNRETVIHRLDPRTKLICLLMLSAIVFIFSDPFYLAAIALGLVGIGALAQSLQSYFRVRYFLLISLVLPIVIWQFFRAGPTVIGHLGPIVFTAEALRFGISAGIRYASLFMIGVLFSSTMPVEEFQIGLIRLGVPYPIAFIFSLAIRLVPTFASVLTTIVEAQVGRGLDLKTRNPVRLTKNLLPLVVPFLVCTIRYGSQLSMALESKGFSLVEKRTFLQELRMKASDYCVFLVLIILAAILLTLRLMGFGVLST